MHGMRLVFMTVCTLVLLVLAASPSFAQTSAEESLRQGKRLYGNGSFRPALEELTKAVEAIPDAGAGTERAEALYLMGYCHVMLREYAEALEVFRRAFQADPMLDPRNIYHPRAAG